MGERENTRQISKTRKEVWDSSGENMREEGRENRQTEGCGWEERERERRETVRETKTKRTQT